VSAIDLIIARGFGPEVRDAVTGFQRGKDQQQAIDNEQRYADQRSAADEFDLKAAQQNQAAALQERGRIAPLQAEYDATLAEIAQIEPTVRAIQAQGGQLPPELLSRVSELDGRLRTIAMRAQPVTSATELFAPRGQATQAKPVAVVGPDGNPVYVDASQAAGMRPWERPQAAPAAPTSRFTAVPVQQPDGTVQTVMVDTTNPANRIPVGAAPAKENANAAEAQTAQNAYNSFDIAMSNVEAAFQKTSTGPLAGRIPAMTTKQQIAEGAVAALAPILKQLFRSAGEGVFTDKDQALLIEMAPKRTDTPEAAAAKTKAIRDIVAAKLGVAAPAAPPPALSRDPAERPAPTRIRIDAQGNVIQ
jgi:hypothetical protein